MAKARTRKINTGITESGLSSSLWKLALPLMAGALLQDLFTLADLFFVGRLGHIEVAALAVSGIIISVIMMAAIGISAGTIALIAHFIGKKDYNSADSVLFQTVVVSVVCSAGMALIGLFGTDNLLRAFGTNPEVIPAASGYLKITFGWSIFIFIFLGLNQALRGAGDAMTPLKVLIFANLVNIALDPLFIYGIGFFPRMEVAGSAVATIISRALAVIILLRHLIFSHSFLHFHPGVFKIKPSLIGRMLKIGFFASFEVLLRQLSIILLLRLVTSFGASCLAACGVGIRLRMAIMMIGFGMGTASSILIGQNMGASRPDRAVKSGWKALKYYEMIILPVAVIFFIFSRQIVAVFSSYPEVVSIGSDFLRFIAVTLPFLASAIILGRGISGAGDTVGPAIMTGITQLGLRVPIAYALVLFFGMGSNGIWLGVNVSDFFHGLMMMWYFKSNIWQKRYYAHRAAL